MLNWLWDWVAGFCVLKISGGRQERLLNLALQRGIEIWDSEWQGEDLLVAKAARTDLHDIKALAKDCGCDVKVGRGQGLPFVWRYLRGRKTLPIGVALFAAGLVMASQVVWVVQVQPQEVLRELEVDKVADLACELGVRPGALWWRLDRELIADELAGEIPEISWVYIERRGTVANIKVAERSIYPEKLENATKGAILANRDGLIEDVLIKHGEAVAKRGDTVLAGDLLVAPLADGRADAIIHARVWYNGYGEGSLNEESCVKTGESGSMWGLVRDDGGEARLWGDEPEIAENQRVEWVQDERRVKFWGAEFCLRRDGWEVWDVAVRQVSEVEAKAEAYQAALSVIYAQQNAASELLAEQVEYELLDGVWRCSVIWECRESIGEHQK